MWETGISERFDDLIEVDVFLDQLLDERYLVFVFGLGLHGHTVYTGGNRIATGIRDNYGNAAIVDAFR